MCWHDVQIKKKMEIIFLQSLKIEFLFLGKTGISATKSLLLMVFCSS